MLLFDNIRSILITLAVLALFGGGMFYLGMKNVETVQPPPVIMTLPGIQKKTEVIRLAGKRPEIVLGAPQKVVVDSTYYYKYMEELDANNRLQLFINAIVIENKTVTVVDDSIVRIDVTSKTRGKLLSQFAEYYVKPRVMTIQPEPYYVPKFKMYVGGILSMPMDIQNNSATLGAQVMVTRPSKGDMFIFGIDSDRFVSVGYGVQLFRKKRKK